MLILNNKAVLYIPASKEHITDQLAAAVANATMMRARGLFSGRAEETDVITINFSDDEGEAVSLAVAIAVRDLLDSGEEAVLLDGYEEAVMFYKDSLPALNEDIAGLQVRLAKKEKSNATIN